MEIRHADLQIEVEDAEDGGVLLTIIDSARLSLSLPRKTAKELLDGHQTLFHGPHVCESLSDLFGRVNGPHGRF